MAKANPILINALREASRRLSKGAKYEWGHMGRCNCGHLVQSITDQSDKEISQTIQHEIDEWSEHAIDYCPNSGKRVDDIFDIMYQHGFSHEDMKELEYLSNKNILRRLNTHLVRNQRQDVILYMDTMAQMLEEELATS